MFYLILWSLICLCIWKEIVNIKWIIIFCINFALWYVTKNKCFKNWSDISDICANLLTGLYVRICDVYMWHYALINYLYVFLNNFKIWLYIYICVQWFFICLENYIEYFEWNCEIKLVLCLTLFCCILCIIAYWMCGSPHQLQFLD